MSLVKFQYDESSAHGVLQQQHDHFCMTMHAASFVQRDGYLSHLSLGWSLCWLSHSVLQQQHDHFCNVPSKLLLRPLPGQETSSTIWQRKLISSAQDTWQFSMIMTDAMHWFVLLVPVRQPFVQFSRRLWSWCTCPCSRKARISLWQSCIQEKQKSPSKQHDHFGMTMHAASCVQRDGYLSHRSLGWLEHLLLV